MKPKMLTSLLCGMAFLVYAGMATADDKSHRKAAEELLELMNAGGNMQAAADQMIDVQIQANPSIAQFRGTLKTFIGKYMSWESIKEEMISAYCESFTEEELKQVSAFYKTPAGKKTVQKMPELSAKGGQIGLKRVQDHMPELIQMLEEEAGKSKSK